MRKIMINIKDNTLVFKYKTLKVSQNLLNTSVISNNELVFSDDYVLNNCEIVGLFLNDLVSEHKIEEIIFNTNDIALIFIDALGYIDSKLSLTFLQDSNLTYTLCEKLIMCKNISKINCYTIPTYLIELLDRHSIKVESRNEVLFASKFMMDNELDSFSKIYYKNSLMFNDGISSQDVDDFKTFCGINKYLKTIHFERYERNYLEIIARILYSQRKKNVTFQIHEDINNPNIIADIKALSKSLKKYDIELSLKYSKDYLEKNYSKQIIFTILKCCSILIFVIVCTIFCSVSFSNYRAYREVTKITNELKTLIGEEDYDDEDWVNEYGALLAQKDSNNNTLEITPAPTEDDSTENKSSIYINNYDKLLEVNKDTVGWLKVNGTKIDYPVVQTNNNDYYLSRNYYHRPDFYGWVFMDYKNNAKNLDDNTIIIAHNNYYSDVMFGTLPRVLNESWYTKESNLYIKFNTLYEKHVWKIFSIYVIDVTNDYLFENFVNDEEHQYYIDMVKNRSDIPLNTEVTTKDKMLTLSTCMEKERRLVVHAVMVK